jgi:tetrahydromethanopterin S-methyltransferase subunit F
VLLHTYKVKHGLDTIEKMIGRYAPPTENDTKRYIEFVSYRSGIARDEELDTLSAGTMKPIAAAISRMENGVEANQADIDEGWELFVEYKP